MKLHREKMLLFAGLGLGLALGGARVASASGYAPWSVTVLVDGSPAPEYSARGRIYIEALKGRTFSVRLSNPTSERVAVALSVDGRNVIDAKRTSAGSATKWILMPGQTADIPGWQISGETSRRFFFTETRRSYAQWLGDTSNAGTIEAVFFRERHPLVAAPAPAPWRRRLSDAPADEERAQAPAAAEGGAGSGSGAEGGVPSGTGGTVRNEAPVLESRSAKTRQEAKSGARPPAKDRESDSFAATGIGDRTAFAVQWISFDEDPVPAARVALRYEFRAELVRLGVFPREDELYARDRGRGFEREYAPDPHRDR